MRLILVRHGESEWNREGRVIGRADIPLSEVGRRQARSVAKALGSERIQVVYCSSLKRAMETGRLIARSQHCPLIPDAELQELDRGHLMGMTREEVSATYPDLQETWPDVSSALGLHDQESLAHLDSRVRRCLNRIRARHSGETVALVGHYFVNLTILLSVLDMNCRSYRSLGQDLAGISIVEIGRDGSRICLLNDTCHLRGG